MGPKEDRPGGDLWTPKGGGHRITKAGLDYQRGRAYIVGHIRDASVCNHPDAPGRQTNGNLAGGSRDSNLPASETGGTNENGRYLRPSLYVRSGT
jgi:hypothetical protein